MKTKVIAFFLPQYHEIPENNTWWGQGFTEWTNVKKARAFFNGHHQPRTPSEGRYYNLLDEEIHTWQAELADQNGIDGFCYYHYWFKGKLLLEKPLNAILDRKTPDFPFCMAWANEPWTRAWDGSEKEILMPQHYGEGPDWEAHYRYLSRFFADDRYIKKDGKPMFLVYRSQSIEQFDDMIALWQDLAQKDGFPGIHVVSMKTSFGEDGRNRKIDAFAEFEPMFTIAKKDDFLVKMRTKFAKRVNKYIKSDCMIEKILSYRNVWQKIVDRPAVKNVYPGAFVDWDNSPRKGSRSLVMSGVTPELFGEFLARQYKKATECGHEYLFINAWNEWAEGTYLEPDERHGLAFLEQVKACKTQNGAR